VTHPRRDVRPTHDFWRDLERQLPAERGPEGEASRTDFQAYELVHILGRFMTGWEDLPPLIPGRDDYRVLITSGLLVPAVAQLAADGAIELVSLRIDRHWPEPIEDDDPDAD
jgi:hypothetical protein